ncbi:MAG: bacillithiol biosynthesis BshC, partial [Chitinophagaceae bacterium]|nr:bacillithiol biosynthesis BshC [Chitinophagaceae bacterium]
TELEKLYELFRQQAGAIDTTLMQHVEALKTKTVHRLQELEKKMLRAEKRKYTDQQRQIQHIKEKLFPGGGLQERRDNIAYYYARWGSAFLHELYEHSPGLEQEFVVIVQNE